MASLLHCLRRNCFADDDSSDSDGDDDRNNNNNDNMHNSLSHSGLPSSPSSQSLMYEPPAHQPCRSFNEEEEGDDDDDDEVNNDGEGAFLIRNNDHLHEGRYQDQGQDQDQHRMHSMFNFMQYLGQQFVNTDSTVSRIRHGNNSTEDDESDTNLVKRHSTLPPTTETSYIIPKSNNNDTTSSSPLTTTSNILQIPPLVVLPGSNLQKQMSLTMKKYGYKGYSDEDECVICMEGFDDCNPRMPTLCGCGENKTFFHLPCLYHWIEQQEGSGRRECPACRQELTWEEF